MFDIEVSRIYRLEGDGATKAFCDIIIANSLLIKGLRIIEGRNGVFVKMPTQQGKDGKWYESIRPVTREIRNTLNETLIKAFND